MSLAVGQGLVRRDGRAKVTGAAKYSSDWHEDAITYGVVFQSAIANGKIKKFDLEQARKVSGVLDILTFENAPRLHSVPSKGGPGIGNPQLPLQNAKVLYYGQPIGIVVAGTLEAAEQGARLVQVTYMPATPNTNFEEKRKTDSKKVKKDSVGRTASDSKGNVDKEIKKAAVVFQNSYSLPIENHHPMEPSATLAVFSGKELKVYESTQGVANAQEVFSKVFKVKKDNVTVITKFVGGGFGCKGSVWTHALLAVMAAQKTKRPVKVAVSRIEMATNVGFRSRTIQDVTLACDAGGKLTAIKHETVNPTAVNKDYPETTGALFKLLYDATAISTVQKLVNMNYPPPTFMRAPGECSGSFALESAVDELAYQLKMDPIDLRLKNYAEKDPLKNIPFSSKSLKECYAQGAKAFGWDRRKAEPASLRDGDHFVGFGMATASYPVHFFPASAKAELFADGTAKVESATQDIGTGTYTVMSQLAADALGLEYKNVIFDLGDSSYPAAGVSGGSSTVSSVGWAVDAACKNLLEQLKKIAVKDENSPFYKSKLEAIVAQDGKLQSISNPNVSESYFQLMKRNQRTSVTGEGKMDEKIQKSHDKQYSQHSFGAQFAEVRVHSLTGEVTLTKLVGAFAAGKIVNPKTARNQFMGGMIFGVGMGLTEHNIMDERSGKFMARDLAEYHVPVNKDIPDIDVIMIAEKDTVVNPAGTKGIGEIGVVGMAAALANAVFNATGIRVRDMPITPDKIAVELNKMT